MGYSEISGFFQKYFTFQMVKEFSFEERPSTKVFLFVAVSDKLRLAHPFYFRSTFDESFAVVDFLHNSTPDREVPYLSDVIEYYKENKPESQYKHVDLHYIITFYHGFIRTDNKTLYVNTFHLAIKNAALRIYKKK